MGSILSQNGFFVQLDRLLRAALHEDTSGIGDITSENIFGENDTATAIVRSKAHGVLSGVYSLQPLFALLSPAVEVSLLCNDGDRVKPGTELARLNGPIRAILAGERTLLNLLQRFSGIATQTSELVCLLAGTGAKLLDTRKTTPTLRAFEKLAVVHGGGHNHRFGLFDMVLIKDTHVRACGGPGEALRRVRKGKLAAGIRIEVEVQTIDEFSDVLQERPDRIMLDNMSSAAMIACVKKRDAMAPAIELEASGNVSAATIAQIAATGVNYISVGSITHSVNSLDIHLVLT